MSPTDELRLPASPAAMPPSTSTWPALVLGLHRLLQRAMTDPYDDVPPRHPRAGCIAGVALTVLVWLAVLGLSVLVWSALGRPNL